MLFLLVSRVSVPEPDAFNENSDVHWLDASETSSAFTRKRSPNTTANCPRLREGDSISVASRVPFSRSGCSGLDGPLRLQSVGMIPTTAIGCATMGIFSIYLAVFNYLADTYHRSGSSALAAQSFCRNAFGTIFPLVTTAMFNYMTVAEASSSLGGEGTLITVVPWVLVFYGPKIRARSIWQCKFRLVRYPVGRKRLIIFLLLRRFLD